MISHYRELGITSSEPCMIAQRYCFGKFLKRRAGQSTISVKLQISGLKIYKYWALPQLFLWKFSKIPLREKCPNTEFFLVRIFLYSVEYRKIRSRNNSVSGHFSRSVVEDGRQKFYSHFLIMKHKGFSFRKLNEGNLK